MSDPVFHGGDVAEKPVQDQLENLEKFKNDSNKQLIEQIERLKLEGRSFKKVTEPLKFTSEKFSPVYKANYLNATEMAKGLARSYVDTESKVVNLIPKEVIDRIVKDLRTSSTALFKNIPLQELFKGGWNEKKESMVISPQLLSMIQFSNNLSQFVIREVLMQPDPKTRKKIIDFYFKVAAKSHKSGDFNSANFILSAMRSYELYNLPEVKSRLDRAEKDKNSFVRFYSAANNYKNMREEITNRIQNGDPIIPFPGFYLTDLTFKDLTASDNDTNGINVKKMESIAQTYAEIKKMQERLQDSGNESKMFTDVAFKITTPFKESEEQISLISKLYHFPERKKAFEPSIFKEFITLDPNSQTSLKPQFLEAVKKIPLKDTVSALLEMENFEEYQTIYTLIEPSLKELIEQQSIEDLTKLYDDKANTAPKNRHSIISLIHEPILTNNKMPK